MQRQSSVEFLAIHYYLRNSIALLWGQIRHVYISTLRDHMAQ